MQIFRRVAFKIEQIIAFFHHTHTPVALTLDALKLKRRSFIAVAEGHLCLRLEPSCGESFTFFENLIRRDYLTSGIVLRPGDTVVDIGANIGSFAVLAAALVGPAGRVIAFEPIPKTYERLKSNLALNGLLNVKCAPVALDASDGKMSISSSYKSALSTAHLAYNQPTDRNDIEVDTITLARACRENSLDRIHLLKVDCEGSEYGIFETMSADLASRIDQIAMEVHVMDGKSTDALAKSIEAHGFIITRKGCNWFGSRAK